MLERFGRKKETEFDDEIERILAELNGEIVGTEEYSKRLVYLERLTDIRKKGEPEVVSGETILIVAGNVLGIMLIVFAEQNHVVVSKGLSFILKPKNRSITV